jgi:hypothetical protein
MSSPHPEQDPVIELFSGTLWEAEMVKSLLNDAGIGSFLRNNVVNTYMYNPIQAAGVKVMILESDLREAREILRDFTKPENGDE